MPTLDEILREEEAKRLAEVRAEIAAEKAAWDALTPEERAAEIAAREAKWARVSEQADPDGFERCTDCDGLFEESDLDDEDRCADCRHQGDE